jgi:hypothetical protein
MVDAQSNFRVNDHTKYRSRGFGTPSVSISLSHAKVAREKKQPAKVAKPKPKPAAAVAPPIAKPPSPIGRVIASYHDFVDVCRMRPISWKYHARKSIGLPASQTRIRVCF